MQMICLEMAGIVAIASLDPGQDWTVIPCAGEVGVLGVLPPETLASARELEKSACSASNG